MTLPRPSHTMHPAIPRVLCPRCGNLMRLAEVSAQIDKPSTMEFDCECDFKYHMSSNANDEAGRA